MGPQSAKSYPGQQLVKPAAPTAQRAKQEIDDGRRDVAGFIFGAFQPASGAAFTQPYDRRTSANWVDFLGAVDAWIDPTIERIYAVVDNLSTHCRWTCCCSAFSLLHPRWEFVFQPTYAAYLTLIEPWWKALKSLALTRRAAKQKGVGLRPGLRSLRRLNARRLPGIRLPGIRLPGMNPSTHSSGGAVGAIANPGPRTTRLRVAALPEISLI